MMAMKDASHDDLFWRFGLLGTGVLAWMAATDMWERGDVGAMSLSVAMLLVTCLMGFVLMLFACGRSVPRVARYVLPVALALIVASYVQIHLAEIRLRGGDLVTDSLIFQEYASHLVLEGVNPYRFDMFEAYRAHQTPINFSTPLVDGSLSGHLPYPALSFLLLVPFLALGLDVTVVYPVFLMAGLVALYFGVKERYRPVILLPFLTETAFLGYALIGVSDPVWAFVLVCMVLAWDRPVGRGLLFGLAISFKQHPWLLLPFLLVRIVWETEGGRAERIRAAGLFAALSAGVFLVTNLPFLLWDPGAWFQGVFEPFLAPMQVFGQGGASVLTTVGWLTIPTSAHVVAVWGLLGVGLLAYARHYPRVPHLLWLVPAIALWFGHRSLTSYWYFFALPFAMDVFGRRPGRVARDGAAQRALWPELALAGALLVGFSASAYWAAVRPPDLEISFAGPHEVSNGRIVSTTVRVRNGTEKAIEPRFQAQSNQKQPLFWVVESGPEILEPGESGVYQISGQMSASNIEVRRGGRISVHPADAHEPRAVARIEGDVTGAWPGVVPNGRWVLWTHDEDKPHFWGLKGSSPDAGRVSYVAEGSRSAVAFEVDRAAGEEFAEVVLSTFMFVPEHPFRIDVRPPEDANRFPDPDIRFGLRLRPGANRVWVLFGGEKAKGRFNQHERYKVIPAPVGQWSTHKIDVRAVLAEFGLRPNSRRMRMPGFPHLDFPMSAMSFDLVLGARRTNEPVVGYFGEIAPDALAPDPRAVYRRAARRSHERSHELILWKADYAAEMGNEDTARELYLEALALRPGMGSAHYQLGQLGLKGATVAEDVEHFVTAAELGHKPGMAYKGAGWASLRLDDLEAAERYFRVALPLLSDAADGADAWSGIAVSLDLRHLCEQAIDAADQARDLRADVRIELHGCGDEAKTADQAPGLDLNTVPAPSNP